MCACCVLCFTTGRAACVQERALHTYRHAHTRASPPHWTGLACPLTITGSHSQGKGKESDYYGLLGLGQERWMATDAVIKQGEGGVKRLKIG